MGRLRRIRLAWKGILLMLDLLLKMLLKEKLSLTNKANSSRVQLLIQTQDLMRWQEHSIKLKTSLITQVEDTKALADAEAKDRAALLTKYKSMSTELENVKEKIENEHMRKADALKALSKAQAEVQLWRSRFETEGMGKIEELESARNKLQGRIVEAEENVDALNTKIANAEKSRVRTAADLEEAAMEYERLHAAALITEKRGKNFDKVLGEWQAK